MEIRKIIALLSAVGSGSLTRAAEDLNYTQSGMTHMMNALEKECGVKLIKRGRNGVRLTPAGERLLPYFQKLAQDYEGLETELRRLTGVDSPILHVGAYSSIAQHWLLDIMQNFRAAHPHADIMVQMGNPTDTYDLVAKGELDCAFVSYHAMLAEGLAWIPLRNDEFVAILPEDWPAKGALFPLRDFNDREFLMPGSGFELDIGPMFAKSGVRPNIRYTNMDDPGIVAMVEHGLGLSILTELVMRGRRNRVLSMPLTPPAYREIGIALRREKMQNRLMQQLISTSQETIMEIYNAAER